MSKLFDAALDPSCLLCLTPQGLWSPIRQGVVCPGAPRNFATEPATWEAFRVAALAIGVHDWQFEIDFLASESVTTSALWHVSGYINTVNIYIVNNAYYVISLCKDGVYANNVSLIFRPSEHGGFGRHRIRVTKIGGTASVYIDDALVGSYDGFGEYYVASAPTTAFNSNIFGVSIKDLTINQPSWSYPSYAEWLRLVTYVNARADRGCLEAANPALGWSIKTALPAGLTGTVLAKINGVVVTNSAKWDWATVTFTGLVTDTLEWLMVRTDTMAAGQIAYLSN